MAKIRVTYRLPRIGGVTGPWSIDLYARDVEHCMEVLKTRTDIVPSYAVDVTGRIIEEPDAPKAPTLYRADGSVKVYGINKYGQLTTVVLELSNNAGYNITEVKVGGVYMVHDGVPTGNKLPERVDTDAPARHKVTGPAMRVMGGGVSR